MMNLILLSTHLVQESMHVVHFIYYLRSQEIDPFVTVRAKT